MKRLNLCMLGVLVGAAVFSSALADDMPFELTADAVSYDTSGSRVVAEGKDGAPVQVTGKDGTVTARKIIYGVGDGRLSAEGDVVFTDREGMTLLMDRMDITGDLKAGTTEQLRLRVPEIGDVAKARVATVSGTTYMMQDVVYSPCKECEGPKPWTISADSMTYDRAEGDVTYRNAKLDVYGVPVMYLPWFKHPLGPKRPKNGLLPPQFGKSTTLGDQVTLAGYYNSAAENADYTVRTRLMSQRGAQLMAERRQMGVDSQSEVKASFLNDIGNGKVRNNLAVKAEKDLTETRRLGIDAELTSDDTYLNQFFNRNDPYLASTAFAEDAGKSHYAAFSVTRFQDLNTARDPAQTAQVLPHVQLDKWLGFKNGGQLDLGADVTSLNRSAGARVQRLVGSADYKLPTYLADGSKLTLGTTLRTDVYNIDGTAKSGTISRFLPEATATLEKPYISAGGYHTVAPMVMAALSPRGGNMNGKVPNEDSVAYELDTSNLFEPSRFAGMDRVETGPRLVYGLDNRWGDAGQTDWRLFVGQSLRKFDDASLPASGGASTNDSDWVGLVEAAPVDWFSLNSRFRLDNATFVARRLDNGLRVGRLDGAYGQLTHTFLDGGLEELNTEAKVPLSDTVKLSARTQHDLANSRLLLGEGGLAWTRDCYELELVVRRRGFTHGDVQPSTDYMLNVQLLSLGSAD